MGISLFLTFIFLHVAFGLALAFFVMYYADKTERKALKTFGFIVGYLLVVLAVLSMILGSVFAATKPYFRHSPYMMNEKMKYHKEMMEHATPMMQEQKDEEEDKDLSSVCPVKTKEELKKEIKEGKRTGAACYADMK